MLELKSIHIKRGLRWWVVRSLKCWLNPLGYVFQWNWIYCPCWDRYSLAVSCCILPQVNGYPDNKIHGANMRPIWGRQDPGGPHVGPMNIDIWVRTLFVTPYKLNVSWCKLSLAHKWPLCSNMLTISTINRYLLPNEGDVIFMIMIKTTYSGLQNVITLSVNWPVCWIQVFIIGVLNLSVKHWGTTAYTFSELIITIA